MADIEKLLQEMRNNPKGIRFAELYKVCVHFFGEPRIRGSHHFFNTPWQGSPLVNLQPTHGRAKAYQVAQVVAAIDKLKELGEGRTDVQG